MFKKLWNNFVTLLFPEKMDEKIPKCKPDLIDERYIICEICDGKKTVMLTTTNWDYIRQEVVRTREPFTCIMCKGHGFVLAEDWK